ncbi:MAG: M24 family metallopeptidase [Planctomycetaceae bacterium]
MNTPPNSHGVQQAAKEVLGELAATITPKSTERSIAERAVALLAARGYAETWYYECPALVLLGSRSCDSKSGRDYVPATEPVGELNLVTVDLSPRAGNAWGDCARSYYVEAGIVRQKPVGSEFLVGYECERRLHEELLAFATRETTCHELHDFANDLIRSSGFENLDFLGNIGHSLGTKLEDRVFIDARQRRRLGEFPCFTLEPHIRQVGGRWGFKHENIYYFGEGRHPWEL